MFRPHPSPGPQWEALEEPTDSSSVEDEEERRSLGTGPFLGKRKETIRLESPKLKRAKHRIGEVGKLGSSSGIHDPGQPGHAATRTASGFNHNASISQSSQRERIQSSNISASAVARPPPNLMGPPPVPNHSNSTDGRFQSRLSSAKEDFPSTLTDEVFNHSRRNSADSNSTNTGGSKVDRDGRTAPHLARKSTGKGPPSSTLPIAKDKEVIEISDDSDEESAPQAKVVAPKRTLPKLPPLRAPGSLPSLPSAASRPTSSSSKDASRRSSTSNVSSHGDSSSRDESMSKPSPRSNQEASTSKSRRLSVTRQVAVKSSGQRRERRRQATSDEESGSAASRPHSRVASVSSIDTRSLNEALGTSSSKGKEPSRGNTVSVKQQPVSPQMPKIGNASSAIVCILNTLIPNYLMIG
ncbi:hypothetical protein CPC08DRAFT_386458 [Agrocybe pediades]|nr:hypothetical protein CPC08DRAFT_386458 [Agrocybe pediades]